MKCDEYINEYIKRWTEQEKQKVFMYACPTPTADEIDEYNDNSEKSKKKKTKSNKKVKPSKPTKPSKPKKKKPCKPTGEPIDTSEVPEAVKRNLESLF